MTRSVPDSSWPKDIRTARIVQETLARRVSLRPLKRPPKLIAGVDACFTKKSVVAAASLYSYPALEYIGDAIAKDRMFLPYVPGYLSFREGPAIIKALRKLKAWPDMVLFDGQGIAHPRGVGIASHVGVVLNIPSIGCAKSRLVGEYDEPGPHKGDWSLLAYKGRKIGAVVRTRYGVRPLFVSPGHRIDLRTSINIVLQTVSSYRLPEPIRRADHLSRLAAQKEAEDEV
ncbi:MAG TPA: deoxyribonuclease V [Thermodesulfovibrionales bacterium]|nr:deoxyribonuclease V [Thermodesulfovibrionales bacterium]